MRNSNAPAVLPDRPEAVAGGSVKAGVDVGFDFGLAKSDDPNTKKKIIDTETVSLGVGGVATPYELPVEFHGGGGYSASSYTANLTSGVVAMANATRSGVQSAYQSALSLIEQEIIILEEEISQLSSNNTTSSSSNSSTNSSNSGSSNNSSNSGSSGGKKSSSR